MVRLRMKTSHLHIVPVIILGFLVAITNAPGDVLQAGPFSDAISCIALVPVAIFCFYCVLPFAYLCTLKESDIGFGLARRTTKRLVLGWGIFMSYFVWLMRISTISVVEGLFMAILFAALTGIQLESVHHPLDVGYALPLTVVAVLLHTWTERRNLGRAALIIEEQMGESPGGRKRGHL